MTNPWDNCLTMGRPVDVGQFYDMRGNGLKNKFVTHCTILTQAENNEMYNSDLIDRKHSDDLIPKLLNISKNQLVREICYPNPYAKELIEFLFPSAQKYIFICYERLTEVKWIGRCSSDRTMDASHIVSRMDYGSIVWIRVIPDNEEMQIGLLYDTYKNGIRLNPMLEANCIIESLTNWKEKRRHKSIKEATEFAELQMKRIDLCPIRYILNRLTSNSLWQQDDNATVPALKNLLRIETAKNSIYEMLQHMNVKISQESPIPLSSTLEEKLINNLKNHKFFKFKKLKQYEYITAVIDFFTQVRRLQLTCYDYMRKRYSQIAMPGRPYIDHVLDMSLVALNFGNDIHKITDENFIQQRQGIFFYNLCTTRQEESLTTLNSNFLLIMEERNWDAILSYSLKWQNLCLLVGLLNGPPKTKFLTKEISKKDEKVFLHINSTFKCFGIAMPSKEDIKAALPNSAELFMGKCQCGNNETRIWICGKCNELIYFGQGKKPCCKCGKSTFNKMGVKCFSENHGKEYLYSENKIGGILPNLCFPSTSSTSKRYLHNKIDIQIDECYEAVENSEIKHDLISIKNSTSTSPIIPPFNIKTTEVQPSASNGSTSFTSIKENDFKEEHITPVSVTHSYNLRSTKNDNINKEEFNLTTNGQMKQRSIVYLDKTAFMGNSEIPKSSKADDTENTSDSNPMKIQIQKEKTTIEIPQQQQEIKNVNIAVIGESGVGKSTLLNAIANYLKFDSAKDAFEKDSLEYIIPCQFKVFYSDFSEKLVSIGMPDENERYEEATVLSTTQECKEYSFEFNGFKINFIDTPGLSDTAGIEKDAKNLEKIRSFICSSLDSLHAICFVLKANEARMDFGFSNSMNDLLSIFPKSALSKVIFFMTHSRGTLYGPGDSMTPLKNVSEKLFKIKSVTFPLTNENIFCVDNESFLFLCAKNQGIEYSGATFEDFEISWKKSKLATQRFFNKVTTFKPVSVRNIKFLKDLENVLMEQKEILSTRATPERWFYHFLTAKTMEFIEVGNIGQKYLDLINMDLIQREANYMKNVDLKKLEIKETIAGIPGFLKTSKTTAMPQTIKFVQNHLSDPNNI